MHILEKHTTIDRDEESGYGIEELKKMIDKGTIGELKTNLTDMIALARSGKGRRNSSGSTI